MNSKNDGTNAGAFDKLLILVAVIGVAVSILAVVVVMNGGGDNEAGGEAGTVQTAHSSSPSLPSPGMRPRLRDRSVLKSTTLAR